MKQVQIVTNMVMVCLEPLWENRNVFYPKIICNGLVVLKQVNLRIFDPSFWCSTAVYFKGYDGPVILIITDKS